MNTPKVWHAKSLIFPELNDSPTVVGMCLHSTGARPPTVPKPQFYIRPAARHNFVSALTTNPTPQLSGVIKHLSIKYCWQ